MRISPEGLESQSDSAWPLTFTYMEFTGGCVCGGTRYVLKSRPFTLVNCHFIDGDDKVHDRTLEVIARKEREDHSKAPSVVAADGKSRTTMVPGKTTQGMKFKNVAVLDKQ
jgi:hypothetical protein